LDSLTALLNLPLPSVFILLLLILIFSSFLKISIVFSIIFYGMGLNSFSSKFATIALALSLSFFSMGSDLEKSLIAANFSLLGSNQEQSNALENFANSWKNVISKSISKETKNSLIEINKNKDINSVTDENSWKIIAPAYIISEIKKALATGFKLLLPFLVIDLVIGYVFTAMDVKSMSSNLLAFPLKLLIFISLDGISLISSGILNSYTG
jgi:flagellar biosynthesis protein FliP